MKLKKWIAASLAAVMAFSVLVSPSAAIKSEAFDNWNAVRVYVYNQVKDINYASISTPEATVKAYAGLTWQQLELDCGVRLNITESACGQEAMNAYHAEAAKVNGALIKVLDMDLEIYRNEKGWTRDLASVNSPLRVCIGLPAAADRSRDYAFVSLKADGGFEVIADLDANPDTITVDSLYFDTFALISGAPGAFNAYKISSPRALDEVALSNYCKYVGTTVSSSSACEYVYSIGTQTAAFVVESLVGGKTRITISETEPGPAAKSIMEAKIRETAARRHAFYAIDLRNGRNEKIEHTAQPIRITMSVPFNFPAYADYAVAVLNSDGSVSIKRDIDTNASTLTIDTTEFRAYAIVWGPDGCFDQYN